MGANTSKPPNPFPAVPGVGPPTALPQNASLLELTFQPALDYDTDSCYPTPGIGVDGRIAPGLPLTGAISSSCRNEARLANTNAYSRSRCAGNWCAIVYTFYFEKDQVSWGPGSAGHRHDWEHVVAWVRVQRTPSSSSDDGGNKPDGTKPDEDGGGGNDELKKRRGITGTVSMKSRLEYISTSAHGYFTVHPLSAPLLFDDTRPGAHVQVVYHKDGGTTHAMRLGRAHDDPPENHRGMWQYPDLVGWGGWGDGVGGVGRDNPMGLRERISAANYGSANFGLKDGNFERNLRGSMPKEVVGAEGWVDLEGGDEFEWVLDTDSVGDSGEGGEGGEGEEGQKPLAGGHDEL